MFWGCVLQCGRGQKTTRKSQFSIHFVASGDRTHALSFGGKHIYQLRHLVGPVSDTIIDNSQLYASMRYSVMF